MISKHETPLGLDRECIEPKLSWGRFHCCRWGRRIRLLRGVYFRNFGFAPEGYWICLHPNHTGTWYGGTKYCRERCRNFQPIDSRQPEERS